MIKILVRVLAGGTSASHSVSRSPTLSALAFVRPAAVRMSESRVTLPGPGTTRADDGYPEIRKRGPEHVYVSAGFADVRELRDAGFNGGLIDGGGREPSSRGNILAEVSCT